jgi:hypothetical protein
MENETKNRPIINFFTNHSILLSIGFYVFAICLLIITHKLSPTNMAGIGLDAPVFVLLAICSVLLLSVSIAGIKKNNLSWLSALINIAGFIF